MAEFSIPNAADAPYRAQAQPDRCDFGALARIARSTGVISGLQVTASVSPDLNTHIAPGMFIVDDQVFTFAGYTMAHNANNNVNFGRFDVLLATMVDGVGGVSALQNAAAAVPVFSNGLETTRTLLAAVYFPPSTSVITSAMIADKRVILRPKVDLAMAVAMAVVMDG